MRFPVSLGLRPPEAEKIIQLPTRERRLGLTDGAFVRKVALAVSYVLPCLSRLAETLSVPMSELMQGEWWREKDTQR